MEKKEVSIAECQRERSKRARGRRIGAVNRFTNPTTEGMMVDRCCGLSSVYHPRMTRMVGVEQSQSKVVLLAHAFVKTHRALQVFSLRGGFGERTERPGK